MENSTLISSYSIKTTVQMCFFFMEGLLVPLVMQLFIPEVKENRVSCSLLTTSFLYSTSRMSLSSWQHALGSSRFSRWNFSWSVISGRKISRQSAGTPANSHIYNAAQHMEQMMDHTRQCSICSRQTLHEEARSSLMVSSSPLRGLH